MRNQNAVILFARTAEVARSGGGDPFEALPWEDLDSVFHACAADLLQLTASIPETDVLLYRHAQFPLEKLPVPAGNTVRHFEMPQGGFDDCVQQAIDGAFLEYYHRVTVVLENNPLLDRGVFRLAADQLGVEDDCAVITPTPDGGLVLLALKTNHPSLFAARGGARNGPPSGPLARLCELDVMLFPMEPSFALGSTAGISLLRERIATLDPGQPDYPRRTGAAFRSLEKKYKWKRSPG
jgi:hypothetical protein